MKTFVDKLREMPTEWLEQMIAQQAVDIQIIQNQINVMNRDLATMETVLSERG